MRRPKNPVPPKTTTLRITTLTVGNPDARGHDPVHFHGLAPECVHESNAHERCLLPAHRSHLPKSTAGDRAHIAVQMVCANTLCQQRFRYRPPTPMTISALQRIQARATRMRGIAAPDRESERWRSRQSIYGKGSETPLGIPNAQAADDAIRAGVNFDWLRAQACQKPSCGRLA
jgi:hypothetical protein